MSDDLTSTPRIGAVHLTVRDLDRSVLFYEHSLGFKTHQRRDSTARLGAGGRDLLILTADPEAQRAWPAAGLYHFAVLVPSRFDLGRTLRRIAQTQTPVTGFADHGVSEAIYLPDPDGNGIEMYRDLPRDDWPHHPDGRLAMKTDPIDIEGILAEVEDQPEADHRLHKETVIGHMHLHVSLIPPAESFYRQVIGMDMIMQLGNQAAFLSSSGYHHHLGLNTWAGQGVPPQPREAIGLRYWEWLLPDGSLINSITDRARKVDVEISETEEGILLRDPSDNGILLMEE
jgi:catechol 2,3-dioxygenase